MLTFQGVNLWGFIVLNVPAFRHHSLGVILLGLDELVRPKLAAAVACVSRGRTHSGACGLHTLLACFIEVVLSRFCADVYTTLRRKF